MRVGWAPGVMSSAEALTNDPNWFVAEISSRSIALIISPVLLLDSSFYAISALFNTVFGCCRQALGYRTLAGCTYEDVITTIAKGVASLVLSIANLYWCVKEPRWTFSMMRQWGLVETAYTHNGCAIPRAVLSSIRSTRANEVIVRSLQIRDESTENACPLLSVVKIFLEQMEESSPLYPLFFTLSKNPRGFSEEETSRWLKTLKALTKKREFHKSNGEPLILPSFIQSLSQRLYWETMPQERWRICVEEGAKLAVHLLSSESPHESWKRVLDEISHTPKKIELLPIKPRQLTYDRRGLMFLWTRLFYLFKSRIGLEIAQSPHWKEFETKWLEVPPEDQLWNNLCDQVYAYWDYGEKSDHFLDLLKHTSAQQLKKWIGCILPIRELQLPIQRTQWLLEHESERNQALLEIRKMIHPSIKPEKCLELIGLLWFSKGPFQEYLQSKGTEGSTDFNHLDRSRP